MLTGLKHWLRHRREIRQRWQADARRLVQFEGAGAYYQAQRRAARARARGDGGEFLHWAKVAAEVARISPDAEMDIAVVEGIVQRELNGPT